MSSAASPFSESWQDPVAGMLVCVQDLRTVQQLREAGQFGLSYLRTSEPELKT